MKNRHYINLTVLGILLTVLPLAQIHSQSLKRLKKELKVWVKLDGAWGLIDGNQQWIIEPNTDYEDCINMYDDMAIMQVKNENNDGNGGLKSFQVINLSGDTLLEFKALQAQFFDYFPTIRFKADNGYGCINLQGDTLVAPIYRRVSEDISDSTRFIISNKDRQYGLTNSRGDILIPIEYKSLIIAYDNRYIASLSNSKQVIISSNNEQVTKKSYKSLLPTIVIKDLKTSIISPEVHAISTNEENWLINSKDGKELFPIMNYLGAIGDMNWFPFQEGNQQGYKNKKGEKLFSKENKYDFLYSFSEKRAVFRTKNDTLSGKKHFPNKGFGIIDKKGNEVVPPIYGFIYSYYNGLASCSKGDKYGLINKKGKVKIPFEYDFTSNLWSNKLITVFQDNKQGILNYQGKTLLPIIYNSVSVFHENRYIAISLSSKKHGVLSQKGTKILPAIYDELKYPAPPSKAIFKDLGKE